MKGGITLKKGDFMQTLKQFPNRDELKNKSYKEIIDKYAYLVDFVMISKGAKKNRFKISIPEDNKELWERFISFCVIAEEYFMLYEMNEPSIKSSSLLNRTSQEVARKILKNLKMEISSREIHDFGGMKLEEWMELCKNNGRIFK